MPVEEMPGPLLGLERITRLLQALGNPHLKRPVIHVAGTNGKGSICAYLDRILTLAAHNTARFNSPHLCREGDNIYLNGKSVQMSSFDKHKAKVDRLAVENDASPFERLTATAFSIFAHEDPKPDVSIIEVGLGGALDATNVVPCPLLTILGPVDLDHQALLGNTVEEIARVKCGIFKAGCPAVIAPQTHPAVVEVAKLEAERRGAPWYIARSGTWKDDASLELPIAAADAQTKASFNNANDEQCLTVKPGLKGSYQAANASTACLAALVLGHHHPTMQSSLGCIKCGVETAHWPGRLSELHLGRLETPAIVDGAHNESAATALRAHIGSLPASETPSVYIVGLSSPRAPRSILEPLLTGLNNVRVVATSFSTPVEGMPWVRAVETGGIARAADTLGIPSIETSNLTDALAQVRAGERVVICGSLYLVADAYRMWQSRDR